MLKKIGMFVAVLSMAVLGLTSCNGGQACASPTDSPSMVAFGYAQQAVAAIPERGGSSGGSSSGSHSSGGGTHSSGGSSSHSSGGSTSKSGSGRSGGTPSKAPSNSGAHASTSPSNSGTHSPKSPFTPSAKTSTFSSGGRSYPASYGHSYTFHAADGSTHVYVIHSHGYYHRGGFHDPYDPYDWTNFSNQASPYYGVHVHC